MFGLIGLVLALLVVGLLAKKQLGGQTVVVPGASPAGAASSASSSSVRAQGAQVQQDFQRQLDQAMQRPKSPADDQ
ncbi:hypothetical protein [Variovorax sp. RHLX14]|uniref:hypothetical protein n=1 Tax=Variovorax sp. RHLX14 TaxID=1259731 RepID=UPI003F49AA61